MSEKLNQAITAIKANDRVTGERLLNDVLKEDPLNETAWLWMSAVAESIEQRRHCLEQVLIINPSNQMAKLGIAKLPMPEISESKLADLAEQTENEPDLMTEGLIDALSQQPSELPLGGTAQQVSAPPTVPPLPRPRLGKSLGRWEQPFRVSREVAERFGKYIDDFLGLLESASFVPEREVNSLKFARGKWEQSGQDVWKMNVFLAPAVRAAAAIASSLEQASQYHEAFWVCSHFGEMSKILLESNREKYAGYFEALLLTACCCVAGGGAISSRDYKAGQVAEIDALRERLDKMCRFALGTFFDRRSGEFRRNFQPDIALQERVVSEALARHFDARLRYLLQQDRPSVKEFVTANMPLVYKTKLTEEWDQKAAEWERLLVSTGYDDLIRNLKSTGDLVRPDKVGQLSAEQLEDVRRAAANNDANRVRDLLRGNADELRMFLYSEARARLDYREPPQPNLTGDLGNTFLKVTRLAATNHPDRLQQARDLAREVWLADINNLELRDWVAYLEGKTNNPRAAEPILEYVRRRRDEKQNFATDWNLAVLAYDRKEQESAYQLLVPLLDRGIVDDDLVLVVLALALLLDDRERFLATIPKTLSLRYHPLAIVVAHDMGDQTREDELLAQLLRQSQVKWELPPVATRFTKLDEFQKTVNQAIVEGQIEQVISWLEARISLTRGWVPNYLELARVHEQERQDIDAAFLVLRQRLEQQTRRKPREQYQIDQACRDLLDLCKRSKRQDLGQEAYRLAERSRAGDALLASFAFFAVQKRDKEEQKEPEVVTEVTKEKDGDKTRTPAHLAARDPRLTERLAWVTAGLTNIRNVASYVQEAKAVEELKKIIGELNPQESEIVVKLIQDTSEVIGMFSRTEANDYDNRALLYTRATGYEKRLSQLLGGSALPKSLVDVITPYYAALKQVMGDLSRQAGISPNIQASIENPFVSFESEHSVLVLRVSNNSERPATDVLVELMVKDPGIVVAGAREQEIPILSPQQSCLLGFSLDHHHSSVLDGIKKVSFGISLRASSEGFPNIDLGFTEREIPVKTLRQAIGVDEIPRLFQPAKPLYPSGLVEEPDLFQGRSDILTKIKGSFYGGVQRERYFLDGIRRVGKTTILNFLPLHLPDNILPVLLNLDKFGLRSSVNSAAILHRFCIQVRNSAVEQSGLSIEVPDQVAFDQDASAAFYDFLMTFKTQSNGRVPFLMIDEFQTLLEAIAKAGGERSKDTLILDLLRGYMDDGSIYAIFTGSVRFDRLSDILKHHIFGSLTRLRVSFLPLESVGDVLRAGVERWVSIPPETVKSIYDLTGGYPWLVQTYGAGLVDLLNQERRTIATPHDVDYVTQDSVLCNNELFSFWWPTDQLKMDEEMFVEKLLRDYEPDEVVPTRDFLASVPNREQPTFKRALDNLHACEVFDSTQAGVLQFRGKVLRHWLEQQIQPDDHLKIPVRSQDTSEEEDPGHVGIFIDHENLIKTLERISRARGINPNAERLDWFSGVLTRLLAEAEKRVKMPLKYRVTVAFWDRPHEASLLSAYFSRGFTPAQPEKVKMENAADFKLADEVRRASEQSMREGSRLGQAVIVTGDGDLSHTARALINDGVAVQIWGGSGETNQERYAEIVGKQNVVVVDDVCGL